jgi:hypothetical protein
MNDQNELYYLEKNGVHTHGIFWIGSSLDEGIKQTDHAASNDIDNYHTWDLVKYKAPDENTGYDNDKDDEVVYSRRKYKRRCDLWPKTLRF